LNLITKLTKRIRVTSKNPSIEYLHNPFFYVSEDHKESGDRVKGFDYGARQLSFLHNYELQDLPYNKFGSIKSHFLIDFYETFSGIYFSPQKLHFNPFSGDVFWDQRTQVLSFGGTDKFYTYSFFKKVVSHFVLKNGDHTLYPKLMFRRGGQIRRVLGPSHSYLSLYLRPARKTSLGVQVLKASSKPLQRVQLFP